jgi:hypothetical protein
MPALVGKIPSVPPMQHERWMKLDDDLGAVRFDGTNPRVLAGALCEALNLAVVNRRVLIWVERLDLASDRWSFPLFLDEDGSSRLEIAMLDDKERREVLAKLRQAGFQET